MNNYYFENVQSFNENKSKFKNKKVIYTVIVFIIVVISFFCCKLFINNEEKNLESVVINDNVSPSIIDISIYSSNENNITYAEIGDVVTLQFRADEELNKIPTAKINGYQVAVYEKDGYYLADYVVLEQFDNDFLLNFEIYDYVDKNGNKGKDFYNTTDNSFVYIIAKTKEIEKVEVSSVKFEQSLIFMKINEKKTINLIVEPENAYYDDVIWQSENSSIASVKDGEIIANGVGKTNISAIIGNFTASIEVNVVASKISPVKLTFRNPIESIFVGDNYKLELGVEPYNATNVNVKWSSSNNLIASVDNGIIYPKKEGVVTITAKTGNVSVSKKINVKNKVIVLEKIQLNTNYETLLVGKKYNLIASVYPSGYSMDKLKWRSDNNNVVTISNGVVTAKAKGEANVIASLDGKEVRAKFVVVENKVVVNNFVISPSSATIEIGERLVLNSTITPSNATIKDIKWSSSNDNVATVINGVVIAKSVGTVFITGAVDGKIYNSIITVKKPIINVNSVYLDTKTATINVNKTMQLNSTILPENSSNKSIIWSSSNTSVATVSATGVVTAKAKGTATITVKTVDGSKTASATITVTQPVTGVSVSPTSKSLNVGGTVTLSATVSPSTANNKSVTWSSSNEGVATVSANGVVTAKAKGTATITVKTVDGSKTASATITVTQPVTGVSVSPTSKSLYVGGTVTLSATVSPSTANNKSVTWSSSNTSVATVSATGVVTAKAKGTATITVKTADGSKTASATITVAQPVTGVSLNASSGTKYINSLNNTVTLKAKVSPDTASNKSVTWSSSDTNVATVENGKVSPKGPGKATITVKTVDGNKSASYVITVKKKVVIIIGASQVTRMKNHVSAYTPENSNNYYSKSNNTLNYFDKPGEGFDYQTGAGWQAAKTEINKDKNSKNYVEFFVYFPMAGNDIKTFTCNPAYPNHEKFISSSNSYINQYANDYYNIIDDIKKSGYQVQGYVVSVHPVVVSQGSGAEYLVTNNNENACKLKYRSNEKYYTFNKAMEEVLKYPKYTKNLKYLSLFSYIMKTNDAGTNFSYKVTYDTTDGIHWDKATSVYYTKLMLNESGVL